MDRSDKGGSSQRLPTPGAQPPADEEGVKLREPHHVAGGIPAVTQSLKVTMRQTGFIRGIGTWLKINKKDGFVCQSCAWPSPDEDRKVFEFCESGAKAMASETTKKQIAPDFFRAHSVADLQKRTDFWLEAQGRLVHPMVKRAGATHYEPIEWDDAFELLALELNALPSPDEAIFYTSGRASNEAAFLYQLFARQFGTNNLPDCSNMCHESSGTGMKEVVGFGKGTVRLEDFDQCDAIFIIGQNPGTNHPRMMTTLLQAKRRGCKIVHVNPLPEAGTTRFKHPQEFWTWLGEGTQLADLFLQVRINGDVALLKGLMKEVLDAEERRPGEILDQQFINQYTTGFEEFKAALKQVHLGDILEQS